MLRHSQVFFWRAAQHPKVLLLSCSPACHVSGDAGCTAAKNASSDAHLHLHTTRLMEYLLSDLNYKTNMASSKRNMP
jgi:hypothetical protein